MINRITLLLFIGLAFILLFSSCASVAIQVVDSDGKPIDEIELELQNNEGNTIAIATPEGGGIYKISKNDISSDSFFVAIKSTDEYFPLVERLSTSEKTNKLKLEDRMTAIVGYVLSDTEDTTPLGNCRVSTFPETIEATTDNTGKFLLKSEQFEKIEYTVYINKPYYMEGSTTFTPRDNEVVTLHQNIYLKPIEMDTLGPIVGPITPPRGGDPVTDGSPVAKTIQDSIINLLKEKEEKPKKVSASKSEEVDVEKELEKYKGLLDKGLITQEDYDAKKKQILGL